MSTSEQLFERALQHIPGGVNSPVRAFKAVGGTPIFIDRSDGAYIYDAEGRLAALLWSDGSRVVVDYDDELGVHKLTQERPDSHHDSFGMARILLFHGNYR